MAVLGAAGILAVQYLVYGLTAFTMLLPLVWFVTLGGAALALRRRE